MSAPAPKPALLVVVGPTAVGKTALALDLCRRFDAELVGADASQVYVGLDIGTGKATPAELGGVRHHLIDVVAPDQPFDAGAYVAAADAAIADITARGRRVVVCGGTGLYVQALVQGLCEAPPASPAVREALQAALARDGTPAIHAELAAVDPAAAARIGPRDAQRIERALGVYRTTGRALSDWQAEHRAAGPRYRHRTVGLRLPRAQLYARIEQRVDAMLAAGWLAEVEALMAAGHGPSLRAMTALGYRALAGVVAGERRLADARHETLVATRRYAKRQMTWFNKVEGLRWLEPPVDPAALDAYVADLWPPPGGP